MFRPSCKRCSGPLGLLYLRSIHVLMKVTQACGITGRNEFTNADFDLNVDFDGCRTFQ